MRNALLVSLVLVGLCSQLSAQYGSSGSMGFGGYGSSGSAAGYGSGYGSSGSMAAGNSRQGLFARIAARRASRFSTPTPEISRMATTQLCSAPQMQMMTLQPASPMQQCVGCEQVQQMQLQQIQQLQQQLNQARSLPPMTAAKIVPPMLAAAKQCDCENCTCVDCDCANCQKRNRLVTASPPASLFLDMPPSLMLPTAEEKNRVRLASTGLVW